VDVLYPFSLLGCTLTFSLEFFHLPFMKHDFSTVI
jgi:hypothetical protein